MNWLFGNNGGTAPAAAAGASTGDKGAAPSGDATPPAQNATSRGEPTTRAYALRDPENLDEFGELLDTGPSPEDESDDIQVLDISAIVDDPTALSKAAEGIDFSKALPKEAVDAFRNAGIDASVLESLANSIGRNAWANALASSSRLAAKGIDSKTPEIERMVNARVKTELRKYDLDKVVTASPNTHEVSQMAIRGLAEQFMTKDPTLSPQRAAGLAKQYLSKIGDDLSGHRGGPNGQSPAPKMDWGTWVNSGKPAARS